MCIMWYMPAYEIYQLENMLNACGLHTHMRKNHFRQSTISYSSTQLNLP